MDELARIRARVAEYEQQCKRAIELGNKPELTPAEISEELELARIVDSGFTLGTAQTLLAIIDAQAGVIAAAGAVVALASETRHTDSDGYTYIWSDGEGKLVAALDKLYDALAALKGVGE